MWIRAPEGKYQLFNSLNVLVTRGVSSSSVSSAFSAVVPSARVPGRLDAPCMVSCAFDSSDAESVSKDGLPDVLASQGIEINGKEYASPKSPSYNGLSSGTGSQSPRHVRPKNGLRSASNAFVVRVSTNADLGKIIAQRSEPLTITVRVLSLRLTQFVMVQRMLLWYTDLVNKGREPTGRILFNMQLLCMDVNQYTRQADRLDIVIGLPGGDIVWLDPISLRYTRLNRSGILCASDVVQIRWVPMHETMFVTAHADGSVLVWNTEDDDGTTPLKPYQPRDVREALGVAHSTSAPVDLNSSGRTNNREKPVANPVAHWRVAYRPLTDMAFSPNGLHLAITSEDNILRIIDVNNEMYVYITH